MIDQGHTHLDITEAVADVAVGACAVASWSLPGGLVGHAQRERDGAIAVRTFDTQGRCIDHRAMEPAEAETYLRHARRSAA